MCSCHSAAGSRVGPGWCSSATFYSRGRGSVGHANVTTTARYLNVKDDYLQELIERKPLTS
jgi:hypothetical protein